MKTYCLLSLSRAILYVWLSMGFVLTMAYKSNLLASLVKKEVEKPIDACEVLYALPTCHIVKLLTINEFFFRQDLLHLPVVLAIPIGTSVPRLMMNSPRKVVRDVYEHNGVQLGGLYDS